MAQVPMQRTVERLEHGPLEQILNLICGVSSALGLPPTDIRLQSILDAGRRRAGLEDWGDERFIEPLAVALDDLARPGWSKVSRAFIHNVGLRGVAHRLQFEALFKRRPELLDTPVERPIFVLGFPRTGTTVVQNLLCLEHGRRGLQFWELTRPLAGPGDAAQDEARRIRTTQREIDFASLLVPEMHQVHYIDARTLEECWPLFTNTFAVMNFCLAHGMNHYGDWLMGYDMEWAYREYRRMLQVLLAQRPAQQLVLKCPEHLWFVDSLLRVFPDACIVWTHRHPFDTVASYSSMITLSRRTMAGKVDPLRTGADITDRFHTGVGRAMAALSAADPARFFHADFREVVRDPKAVVRQIEAHFGLPATTERAMDEYLATPREDARGKHLYDAERYGIRPEAIAERFEDYISAFDLERGADATR